MQAFRFIQTDIQDRIFIVTINRPEVMNALSPQTNFELAAAFDHFEANDELWVAIITGAGDKAFSSGGDIAVMSEAKDKGDYEIPDSGYGGLTNRFSCDKPIIAAVNGLAMGGGFETALACDLIVASDTALFGLPEPKIGVAAVGSGIHRIVRDIGLKPAMDLLLTGRAISAQKALELQLINQVVPPEDVMTAALQYANKILACAPLAVRATKHCAHQGLAHADLESALRAQLKGKYQPLEVMLASQDTQEGLAAFMEKRKPNWQGK